MLCLGLDITGGAALIPKIQNFNSSIPAIRAGPFVSHTLDRNSLRLLDGMIDVHPGIRSPSVVISDQAPQCGLLVCASVTGRMKMSAPVSLVRKRSCAPMAKASAKAKPDQSSSKQERYTKREENPHDPEDIAKVVDRNILRFFLENCPSGGN